VPAPAPPAPAVSAAAPLPPPAPIALPQDDARRDTARLEADLREARETLELAEQKIDAALKTIWERDVQIARLEADVAANQKLRDGSEGFIRHLEARLDKTEERSEEKEKEIRRLAVGLGEARGEIRLLKPPAPEPSPALRRRLGVAASGLVAFGAAALCGWIAWQLATRSFHREAGIAAAVGTLAAFAAGVFRDRLRRTK